MYGDINYDAMYNVNLYKRKKREVHIRENIHIAHVERNTVERNMWNIHSVASVGYYLYDAAKKKNKNSRTLSSG